MRMNIVDSKIHQNILASRMHEIIVASKIHQNFDAFENALKYNFFWESSKINEPRTKTFEN